MKIDPTENELIYTFPDWETRSIDERQAQLDAAYTDLKLRYRETRELVKDIKRRDKAARDSQEASQKKSLNEFNPD